MVQSSQPAEQAASRSKRILHNVRRWLVEPSPAIVDPEEQRRAQLRALVLLLASPFFVGMIFLFLPYISRQDGVSFWEEPFNLVVIGYTIGLCLAYALSRTRYSLIGGVFGLAISAIAFLAGVYLKPATLSYESIVVYLIILFALCSFFFTLRQMVWVGLGYLLVMALAAILSPQMVAAIYYSLLPLALLVPIFSLLYMLYRDQQEAARQEAFEKNAQRTEALFRISQVISSTLRRDDLFRRIASQMGQAVDATSAYICSFDPDRMESTVLAEYYSPNACPEELVSDLGDTYAEGEVFDPSFIEAMKTGGHDYSHIDDPDLAKPEREHLENYGAKTVLYIPLLVQGRLVGYAELWESRRRREFSPEQIALCHSIAQQAAVALENVSLHEQLQLHAAELGVRVAERTEELEQANKELLRMGQIKDEFVANISHELRTPITNIKLYLDLMKLKPQNTEQYAETLRRETQRLENIVEDLLYLRHLDQLSVMPSRLSFDFNILIQTLVDDRQQQAGDLDLALTFEPAADLPPVLADQAQIGKAVSILLANALGYTPPGGRVSLSTRAERKEDRDWIALSVHDTGPGISQEELSRLFERFYRGKAALESGQPGTGLGLSIARQILNWYCGRIEVESAGIAGEGTTFTLWLPVGKPAAGHDSDMEHP